MPPLFAEVPDWMPYATMVIGGAVAWLANWLASQRKEEREAKKQDEKGIVIHQSELIERQTKAIEDLQKRCDRLSDRLIKYLAHMSYLEGVMTAQGIEFKRLDLDKTDQHQALAEDQK